MAKVKDDTLPGTEGEQPSKPKRTPRPMNPVIHTLARIDRLMSDHSETERSRIAIWLMDSYGPDSGGFVDPAVPEASGQ